MTYWEAGIFARSAPTSTIAAYLDRVFLVGSHPVSAASVAAFRVLFGLLGLAAVCRFASKGWIDELYVQPVHYFTYSGFWWVQPWPAWGMYVHFALLGLASLGVALGYRYRLSIIAFFLLFTYVELIDKTTYLNHYYWVSLTSLLMVFLPLHKTASLDAMRDPSLRRETVAGWVLWVLRAQVGVVYLFGGIAKLNPDWLFEAQPLRIWLHNNGDLFLVGPLLREAWVAYTMSWTGAAFDLTIVGWLLWSRSRTIAYVVLVVFHVMTWLLFPIGMFPWLMIFGATVFFPPKWPHRVLPKLRRGAAAAAGQGRSHALEPSWASRAWIAAVLLFALAQVVMPLRHWAYPGNVRWNEDGYRFSWRIMLTEKTGLVRFRVTDRETGEQWVEYPEKYLTPLQYGRMAYQPDMILATAHIIAQEANSKGRGVQVRADAFVTMNGRPAARFVDPDVDLVSVKPGPQPKSWVLPVGRASELTQAVPVGVAEAYRDAQ